jgi:two-component system CheB/CheR fusion protein
MAQPCFDPLDIFFTAIRSKGRKPLQRRDRGCGQSAAVRAKRIVIADDNLDTVESLKMLLEAEGHQVSAAHDGAGAMQLAQALQPDFVLLDIGMPRIDGYDVARQIRSQSWGRQMRLVAITGWGQPADRACALQAGFDYHLTKPVALEVLGDILGARGAYALLPVRRASQ